MMSETHERQLFGWTIVCEHSADGTCKETWSYSNLTNRTWAKWVRRSNSCWLDTKWFIAGPWEVLDGQMNMKFLLQFFDVIEKGC